jgi:NAD(P)-dependent dehydrogenase (short-subunit alcohol dehydrogenase family)
MKIEDYKLDEWRDRKTSIFDKFSLKGKKAIVTGGAGGFGRNVGAAFADAGADVALIDLDTKKEYLDALAKEMSAKYGVKVAAMYCDVTSNEQVEALRQGILKTLGTIDVAFINAGVCLPGEDKDIPWETWQKNIDINLHGAFRTAQMTQKMMRAHQHGGSIIMTSSMSAYVTNQMFNAPTPVMAYSAAKAGISQYARTLAAYVVDDGIRVNTIAPGYMWSGIHAGLMSQEAHDIACSLIPMKRFGTNDEMQGLLLFLASDASSYITGTNIPIDGGYMIY